jgi:hypothetical protein
MLARMISSRRNLLLIGVILMCGCGANSEELWRVTSPDSRVDAVLVKAGGPATVGFSYKLFVVPKGAHPGNTGELLLADHVSNLTAVWPKPGRLEIRYEEARIFSFSNFWQAKKLDNFKYIVELRLVPTGQSQLPSTSK